MDPYETLGITPAYEGDLRALRNLLVKRYFEAGETPDEERMKAINAAYELLSDQPRPRLAAEPLVDRDEHARRPRGRASPTGCSCRRSAARAPYTLEAALPPGLTLDRRGRHRGRLERTGQLPFTLSVTDRDGRRWNARSWSTSSRRRCGS